MCRIITNRNYILGIYVKVLGGESSWLRNKEGLESSGKEPDNMKGKGSGVVRPDKKMEKDD